MKIPEQTRKRLLQLIHVLKRCKKQRITSVELEKLTGFTSASIRKDISCIDFNKGVSNGYNPKELLQEISDALEVSAKVKKCCIVGLGGFGASLLETNVFDNTGFKIVAGFDSNVNRTEILTAPFELFPASKLEQIIEQEKIEYAILTCSDESSQTMALRLKNCKIKGIVNYTNEILHVQDSVFVENVSPLIALTSLLSRK